MKTILVLILMASVGLSAFSQSGSNSTSINNFLLSLYKTDSFTERRVDTVIKLPGNCYFALVKTTINSDASGSGYFDCYEVGQADVGWQVNKSTLNMGNGTGGSGLCEMEYSLRFLGNGNYLLLAVKKVSEGGFYCSLYVLLNSAKMLIETDIVKDPSGYFTGTPLNELLSIQMQGKYLKGFSFDTRVTEIEGESLKVSGKHFHVSGFLPELNCFSSVASNPNKLKRIKMQ